MNRLPEWAFLRWGSAKHGLRLAFELLDRTWRYLLLTAGIPIRREFLILRCVGGSAGSGLFSEFCAVLGALDHYEKWKRIYAGLRVDFADHGLYYDPAHGENWWKYYFEPIEFGRIEHGATTIVSVRQHDIFAHAIARLSRKRGHALIGRHVRPKTCISDKVEPYVRENFHDSFVIGIHYRGTDKFEEAPRIPYERVHAAVLDAIKTAMPVRYKLFVATDEQAFLDYMLAEFPGVLAYRTMSRSIDGKPTHLKEASNYDKGEDAIIDCLLLARSDYLIRTASNLSLCSTLIEPELPVKLLNCRS